MIRESLLLVLCALTLGSCSFQHIMSEDEFKALDRATLDFDIDWSDLDEKPKGMTLYFFPCDENPIDTTIYHYSYNNVDHVRVYLPEQDYAVICFNRSEAEFADLKFDFSSFDGACVMAKEEGEVANTKLRSNINGTRAYSANSTLKPSSFGSASKSSVRTASRAYSANSTLKPTTPIKGMSIRVNAFGLNSGVRVTGKITNLSSGVYLKSQAPLESRLDQTIGPNDWSITLPTDSTKPGSISVTFGTFGVPGVGHSSSRATRALFEQDPDTISDLQNMLELVISLPDGDSVVYQKDVTEIVEKEFERILEQEQIRDSIPGQNPVPTGPEEMIVEIGDSNDTEGSNNADEDGETSSGTLILHHTVTGTNIKVSQWETRIIDIEL